MNELIESKIQAVGLNRRSRKYYRANNSTDSPSRHSFLVTFQDTCNRYDHLADVRLADSFKRTILQASIMHDIALLGSWNTVNEVKHAMNPGAPSATYSEFYTFLIKQAKTHDIAIPFKRSTRHAHKANFDFTFVDDSNEHDDDEDSVLGEVLAHMSVQNEPMSEETVNALQASSRSLRLSENARVSCRGGAP
jgi:hypothetical protein